MQVLKRNVWRLAGWCAAGGVVLQFGGGCGLSNQQMQTILTSVVSTGLNTLVTQFVSALVGTGAA